MTWTVGGAKKQLEEPRTCDLVAAVPSLIAQLRGQSLIFVMANQAYLEFVDRDRNALIGKNFAAVFPELEEQGCGAVMRRVLNTREMSGAKESERKVTRNGERASVYVEFWYLPVQNQAGETDGVLVLGIDVTEKVAARAILQHELKERTSEVDRMRSTLLKCSERAAEMQEEEQRRLALELHDSAGQLVTALRWKLLTLQREIGGDRQELARLAERSVELLNELSRELRTTSHLLHPPTLEHGGLVAALQSYVDGIAERSGMRITVQIDPIIKLPLHIEKAVFRIIQESLTNVHRHAKSRVARVCVTQENGMVLVQIKDRGTGIPGFKSLSDPTLKLGVGIRGMRERVHELNGTFHLYSNRTGTTIKVKLPTDVVSIDEYLGAQNARGCGFVNPLGAIR